MLRAIWSKSLRDYRGAIIGWGVGLGLIMCVALAYVSTLSESGLMAAAGFAESMSFLGDPVAVATPEGYVTWDTVGIMPLMLGIWTLLAGARLVRGEEERGSLDVLLATPRSRARMLIEKVGALVMAVLLISLLIGLGCVVGEAWGGLNVAVGGALLTGLNIGLTSLVYGMVAFLLSQALTRPAAAAGWAAGFMVFSYLLNGAGRIVENAEWIRRFSPLYYHDESKPLIASYGSDPGAFAVLIAVSLGLAGISLLLFVRRDVGGTLAVWDRLRRAAPQPRTRGESGIGAWKVVERDVFERSAGLRALRSQAAMFFWWLVGMVVLIGWVMALARTTKDALATILESSPSLNVLLGQYNLNTDVGYIAAIAFLYLPIIFVLFTLTIAMAWPRDVESGRMELPLATPQPRGRIFLERFGVVALAAVALPAASWLVMLVSGDLAGLEVDPARLAVAYAGIVPLELLTAAAVYALAGWLRAGLVIAVVGALIGISYIAELLNTLLKLPEWAISLSIFHQYGSPLTEDARWLAWLALLGIAAALVVVGAIRFSREDVRQGA